MTADYLVIEPFLHDALQARTLQAAFDLGIVDRLAAREVVTQSQLFRNIAVDTAGAEFVLEVLKKSGVLSIATEPSGKSLDENSGAVATNAPAVALTPTFRAALKYRDLLQTKLQFSELVAPDFFARLPQLLNSSEEFMSTSKLFELFDYSRCYEITPENCLRTSRWMQLTTMLTRYEAPICCDYFSFDKHHRMLDLGGNSGEFAVQVCQRSPALHVTVADLPVVCHVGTRHIQPSTEASRIQFQPLHFVDDALPDGHDLITFKSVLHDWPDHLVELLLQKSFEALPAGGRILIFERQRWDLSLHDMPYGLLPVLLFFRSYRKPDFYTTLMTAIGFTNVTVTTVQLEVPFMIVSAETGT